MPRTFDHTHTAAEADRFINHCAVVCHFNGPCCTGLLANTAADTADRTDLSGLFALLLVGTANHDKIRTFMDVDDFLRAFTDAFTAGNAFIFIDFRYTVFIDCDSLKRTDRHTDAAANTAIFAVLSFLHMASAITGYNS